MPHLIETKQALSNPEDDMPRNLYGADHEAFRKTARELVERSLKPRDEQFGVFPLFWTPELGCQMVDVPES